MRVTISDRSFSEERIAAMFPLHADCERENSMWRWFLPALFTSRRLSTSPNNLHTVTYHILTEEHVIHFSTGDYRLTERRVAKIDRRSGHRIDSRSRLQTVSTIQSGMDCRERRLCMKVNINAVSLAYARVAGRRAVRGALVIISHECVSFVNSVSCGRPVTTACASMRVVCSVSPRWYSRARELRSNCHRLAAIGSSGERKKRISGLGFYIDLTTWSNDTYHISEWEKLKI